MFPIGTPKSAILNLHLHILLSKNGMPHSDPPCWTPLSLQDCPSHVGHPGNGRSICPGAAPVFDASLASEDEAVHAVYSKGEVWGNDQKIKLPNMYLIQWLWGKQCWTPVTTIERLPKNQLVEPRFFLLETRYGDTSKNGDTTKRGIIQYWKLSPLLLVHIHT